jgi:hypothetical protein
MLPGTTTVTIGGACVEYIQCIVMVDPCADPKQQVLIHIMRLSGGLLVGQESALVLI